MKKALAALVAFSLLAAACGDDGGAGGSRDPASANSCEELADVSINLMQDALHAVEGMSIEDFMAISETGDLPEELSRMEAASTELEQRATDLGCSPEDAQRLICDRVGQLKAEGDLALMVLTSITESC